tara:strand:- start:389 stop:805 length:417 start_codon:yes stop_codon:yes gene_type:complete
MEKELINPIKSKWHIDNRIPKGIDDNGYTYFRYGCVLFSGHIFFVKKITAKKVEFIWFNDALKKFYCYEATNVSHFIEYDFYNDLVDWLMGRIKIKGKEYKYTPYSRESYLDFPLKNIPEKLRTLEQSIVELHLALKK